MVNNSTSEDSQRLYLNNVDCNIFKVPSHLLKSFGPVLPSKVMLRVDESGKEWIVSIEMFKDHYFFTDGWKEFAKQVDLKSLDFLTFTSGSSSKQKGKSTKKTRKRSDEVNVTASSIQNPKKDKRFRAETELRFSKVMKEHNRYRVDIPKHVVLGVRIHKDEEIKLRGGEGREWPVRVTEKSGTFSMGGGWGDFAKYNKVMLGSTISFTWLSGKTLQTEIVDVGKSKQPLFCTRKNSSYNKGKHSGS